MSYRELHMLDVVEVLHRWQAGQSARAISRAGVGDRKTVGRYIEAAKGAGVGVADEVTDDVVRGVLFDVQERPAVVIDVNYFCRSPLCQHDWDKSPSRNHTPGARLAGTTWHAKNPRIPTPRSPQRRRGAAFRLTSSDASSPLPTNSRPTARALSVAAEIRVVLTV